MYNLYMKKARYICLEGTEGVGKTTQTQKLVDYLRSKGYTVLQTKEPGTPLSPLTMQLRGIMLDKQYDNELTPLARELVSQAIRSIHLEKVILPAINEYDFIVQDRGILSGMSYGTACGHNFETIDVLVGLVVDYAGLLGQTSSLYDDVIYLKGSVSAGLDKALSAKQEFKAGDAMEAKGVAFLNQAANNMDELSSLFNTSAINVDGKSIDQVFDEILAKLHL